MNDPSSRQEAAEGRTAAPGPSRYDQLSERARFFLENLDELDLAEACARSEAEIARLRERLTEQQKRQVEQTVPLVQRVADLQITLTRVLSYFAEKGHPGEPCLRTGWIRTQTVEAWRGIANKPKDQW